MKTSESKPLPLPSDPVEVARYNEMIAYGSIGEKLARADVRLIAFARSALEVLALRVIELSEDRELAHAQNALKGEMP